MSKLQIGEFITIILAIIAGALYIGKLEGQISNLEKNTLSQPVCQVALDCRKCYLKTITNNFLRAMMVTSSP
jgi:hypothetical protein